VTSLVKAWAVNIGAPSVATVQIGGETGKSAFTPASADVTARAPITP